MKYLRLIYRNPRALDELAEPERARALAEIAEQLSDDAAESSNHGDAAAAGPHHDVLKLPDVP